MSTDPIPLRRKTHDIVAELVDIAERIDELKARDATLRAQLAAEPVGTYHTPAGSYTVKPPARKFDHARAWESLPEAARDLCYAVAPALVKAQIPPAVVDAFMVAPEGAANTVSLR